MLKLKFFILFIAFIQVVPTYIDILEARLLDDPPEEKCYTSDGKYIKMETKLNVLKEIPFYKRMIMALNVILLL